ncbi:sodium:proton antiporter, partial [Gammaproteobacteria bacterium]|nr:sodium:proton antiporter [Gammaproteobacteria bacterium]
MDGIETYFGNPISDHADRYLDLSGIGNLICLSGRANFDVLAAMHYRREFGSEHLYELPTSAEGQQHGKHRIGKRLRGKHLFGEDVMHNQVLGHLRDNWVTKETGLTLEFGLEQYLSKYADKALILCAIDPSDRLRLVTDADDWTPEAGWKVISLVDDNEVG